MENLTNKQLRDKVRKDFEDKVFDGETIFFTAIRFDENKIYLYDERGSYFHFFNFDKYEKTLSQCRKPFPKDGFCINLSKDKEVFINLCGYIAKTHKCNWIDLSFSPEEKRFTEVTIQELKDEAVRILTEKK